jgi:hypothetical protein
MALRPIRSREAGLLRGLAVHTREHAPPEPKGSLLGGRVRIARKVPMAGL